MTAVALVVLPGLGSAQAEVRPEITHGSQLTPAMTGLAGLAARELASKSADRKVFPGATIRDGGSYPFVRRIERSAFYDGFAVKGPHLLVENVDFSSGLDLFTSLPVVFRGVRVAIHRPEHWGILSREQAGRFYFLWSEVTGDAAGTGGRTVGGRLGIGLYLKSPGAIVYRSHVSRASDGIQVHAPGAQIIETVIDDLVHFPGDHNDGVQMLGRASALTVLRSRIENANPLVGCINLNGTPSLIAHNVLAGGGFAIYGGARRNGHDASFVARGVRVEDNVFAQTFYPRSGRHGPVTYWDSTAGAGNVWRGNRFDDGAAIPDPGAH
ncbi:MAG: hypothetical protein ACK5JT_10915 [Hyphomicrobiaceae bacterium]